MERLDGVGRGEWLSEAMADSFQKKLDRLRGLVEGGGRSPVLVAEADPVDFLAVFFAALLAGRPVVAGNAGWARREWEEAWKATGARRIRATGEEFNVGSWRQAVPELAPGEVLIPTGGSSGRLRFARHSWGTLAVSAEGFSRYFGGRPVNSVCVLPLFHVSGLMQVVRAIVTGGRLWPVDWRSLEAGTIPDGAADFFLSLVPSQLRKLLAVEELHDWLRSARAIPLGGAPAPRPLLDEAGRLRLPVALCYGATETSAMVTAQKPEEFLSGDRSSGRVLPHASVRIAGDDGRVWVGGKSLFYGYVPGRSRIGAEWMTGDLGRLDAEGRLTVKGRADDAVMTGGEKVYPEEVERVLLASGLVEDAVVVGVSDSRWGQAVAAVYVSAKGASPEQLRAAVKAELASFKAPKFWVAVPEVPRTAQGKVDRLRVDLLLSGGGIDEGRGLFCASGQDASCVSRSFGGRQRGMSIDAKLAELGLELPPPPSPAGNYVPTVQTGNLLYVAGQLAIKDGVVTHAGQVGKEQTVESASEGARIAALNTLSAIKAGIGSLDKVKRIVLVNGFVNAVPNFGDSPAVLNGASDLFVAVFGEKGKHARAAVAVAGLPRQAAVEIQVVVEVGEAEK